MQRALPQEGLQTCVISLTTAWLGLCRAWASHSDMYQGKQWGVHLRASPPRRRTAKTPAAPQPAPSASASRRSGAACALTNAPLRASSLAVKNIAAAATSTSLTAPAQQPAAARRSGSVHPADSPSQMKLDGCICYSACHAK